MSTLAQIAKLIPGEYRKELLELNIIDSAIAIEGNQSMHYLAVIWKNYIEHDFETDCNLCRARVLTNMKAIRKELIELEKQHNLLKSV